MLTNDITVALTQGRHYYHTGISHWFYSGHCTSTRRAARIYLTLYHILYPCILQTLGIKLHFSSTLQIRNTTLLDVYADEERTKDLADCTKT